MGFRFRFCGGRGGVCCCGHFRFGFRVRLHIGVPRRRLRVWGLGTRRVGHFVAVIWKHLYNLHATVPPANVRHRLLFIKEPLPDRDGRCHRYWRLQRRSSSNTIVACTEGKVDLETGWRMPYYAKLHIWEPGTEMCTEPCGN